MVWETLHRGLESNRSADYGWQYKQDWDLTPPLTHEQSKHPQLHHSLCPTTLPHSKNNHYTISTTSTQPVKQVFLVYTIVVY